MPKVTKSYLETKKQQVLAAAVACFSRNGFHQTTMQDICREARISAGAVYRYFSGKEEIIESIAAKGRQNSEAIIAAARALKDTKQVLNHMADGFFSWLDEPNTETAIRTEINLSAEALRDPKVLALVRKGNDSVRTSFADIIREAQSQGDLPKTLDPDAVARVLMSLYIGLLMQKAVDKTVNVQQYLEVMKSLEFVERKNVDETPEAS